MRKRKKKAERDPAVCVVCGGRLPSNPGDPRLPPGFCSRECLDYYAYSIIAQVNYLEERGVLPGHSEEEVDQLLEAYDWVLQVKLWRRRHTVPYVL